MENTSKQLEINRERQLSHGIDEMEKEMENFVFDDKRVRRGDAGGSAYLLIDTSGSMEGGKLSQAVSGSVNFAKRAFNKGYSVGLIQFNNEAIHICDPSTDIEVIMDKIKSLVCGGGTDMAEGLNLAHAKIKESKASKKVIVLVTDGAPNNEQLALDEARNIKENKIDIISIGTEDANQELLKKIASCSDLSMAVTDNTLGMGIGLSAEKLPELLDDGGEDLFLPKG